MCEVRLADVCERGGTVVFYRWAYGDNSDKWGNVGSPTETSVCTILQTPNNLTTNKTALEFSITANIWRSTQFHR